MSHHYSVNVMDEHVLKGNSAILKCHIPSFVSDFVFIDAWIDDETQEEFHANIGEKLGWKRLFSYFIELFLSYSLSANLHLINIISVMIFPNPENPVY